MEAFSHALIVIAELIFAGFLILVLIGIAAVVYVVREERKLERDNQ